VRKKIITEGDLQVQLATLDEQEIELTNELSEKRLMLGNRAERLIYLAGVYRDRARLGYAAIQTNPDTPEAAEAIFQARRKIIDGLLVKAEVFSDKSVKVHLELDLEETTEDESLRIKDSLLRY
jgi:hypothetical protein